VKLGYALSSEEHPAPALVDFAKSAEEAGFSFAMLSDHFHPWTDRQGNSPFAWAVLGAIASTTDSILLGTGVTCPLIRTHPVVIAQAAATIADLAPDRFALGLGTGELLNEHVTGESWPPIDVRLEMLDEAIEIIRALWSGEVVDHYGDHYTVEGARVYVDAAPPIWVAASGGKSGALAGAVGDGLISTSPDRETLDAFASGADRHAPRIGQVTVCWAPDESDAAKVALEWWPNAALPSPLGQDLRMPAHFEQAVDRLDEDDIADAVVCGPDPRRHLDAIEAYADAGFDHVYIHQVGLDQDGFFSFYRDEILPAMR